MTRTLTCIGCPLGCQVTLTLEESGEIRSVTGNTCKRGERYARKELTNPTRTVTTCVPVDGALHTKTVSCKTATDVPKHKIFEIMQALKAVRANAPVKIGDVLLKDAAGTGVDIVATKNVD